MIVAKPQGRSVAAAHPGAIPIASLSADLGEKRKEKKRKARYKRALFAA